MRSFIVIQQPTPEELPSKRRKWYQKKFILKIDSLDTYCGQGAWGHLKFPGALAIIHKSYIKLKNHDVSRTVRYAEDTITLAGFIALEYCNFITNLLLTKRHSFLISLDDLRAWLRYSRYSPSNAAINIYWIDLTRETFSIQAPATAKKIILNLKELEDEAQRDYEIGRCTGIWAKPYFNE